MPDNEIITDSGRRRHWSPEDKLQVFEETPDGTLASLSSSPDAMM
jgi:hypothetical protein